MKITTTDLKDFTYCPAYHSFKKKSIITPIPDTKKFSIIKEVIKKSYSRSVQDKKKPDWKMILGWIDRTIFKDLDVMNNKEFEYGRHLSEVILGLLKPWYENIYSEEEDMPGYSDLSITTEINGLFVEGNFPIIKPTDPPTLLIISNTIANKLELLNNIEVRTLAWILSKELESDEIIIEYLFFNESNSVFKKESIRIQKKQLDSIEDIILQVGSAIKHGVNYPSRTIECPSCPFYRRCVL